MIRVLALMDGTGTGGAEYSMAAMAPHLAESGIDLEVGFFYDRPGAGDIFRRDGIPTWHVVPHRLRLITLLRLRRLIRLRRPDLVHTMIFEADILGRIAAKLSGVPVISSIVNDSYNPASRNAAESKFKYFVGFVLDVMTAQLVDHVHCVADSLVSSVLPRLRIKRKPVTVIRRGRDLSVYAPIGGAERERIRQELGIARDQRMFTVVGRQEYQKGIDRAVSVMQVAGDQLPDSHLFVAGRDGNQSQELRDLVSRLEISSRVTFLGHRNDIPALVGASDVVIAPSRWEGAAGAALEALLCGTRVVASDIPQMRELAQVTDPDLISLFDPEDKEDLIRKLLAALDSDTRDSCLDFRHSFASQNTALLLADLYTSCADRARSINKGDGEA